MEATEDSAMATFIFGFSSSKLNGFDFLVPFLSFLDFLLVVEGVVKVLFTPETEGPPARKDFLPP